MVRSILLGVLFLSATGFARQPIMQFPGGYYLGEGSYTISNGASGTYASFIDLNDEEWVVSYVRHGKPLMYTISVAFDDLGFFDAEIIDYGSDDATEGYSYLGTGYCGSKQCHLSFDLGDRYIEETITLMTNENRIMRLGSLSYFDEYGDEQTVAYEELMVRIAPGVN